MRAASSGRNSPLHQNLGGNLKRYMNKMLTNIFYNVDKYISNLINIFNNLDTRVFAAAGRWARIRSWWVYGGFNASGGLQRLKFSLLYIHVWGHGRTHLLNV